MRRLFLRLAEELLLPAFVATVSLDALGRWWWDRYDGIDAQIYAVVAALWQEGWIPYRDVYDFKPPMIYAVLRAGWSVWGTEPDSLRKAFVVLIAGGSLLSYLGLRLTGRAVAGVVAAVALLTLFVADPWRLPFHNTEMIAVAFAAAAFGCAAAHQGSARPAWAVATGAFLMLAFLGKQPAAFYALPLGLQLSLPPFRLDRAAVARFVAARAIYAALGCAIVLLPVLAYFAAHQALEPMWAALVEDGIRYTEFGVRTHYWWQSVMAGPAVYHLLEMYRVGAMWPFLVALAGLVVFTLWRPDRWCAVAWTWLIAAVLAIAIGPRAERHYVMFALPALAIGAGVVAEEFVRRIGAGRATEATRPVAGMAMAALLFATMWGSGYIPQRYRVRPDVVQVDPLEALGARIRAVARQGDTLEVVDERYMVFVDARLPPASPHFYRTSPNPLSQLSTDQRIEKRPTFLFLEAILRDRLELAPEGVGLRILRAEYEEWSRDELGSVYRRKSDGGAEPAR